MAVGDIVKSGDGKKMVDNPKVRFDCSTDQLTDWSID
jgi:hypothetical protein